MRHGGDVGAHHIQLVDSPEPPLLVGHGYLALWPHGCDEQHVRRVGLQLKVLGDPLPQHAGCEGTKAFPKLDLQVHLGLHPRAPRVAKDAPGAECPRTELHTTVEPSDHVLLRQELGYAAQQAFTLQPLVWRVVRLQPGPDLLW